VLVVVIDPRANYDPFIQYCDEDVIHQASGNCQDIMHAHAMTRIIMLARANLYPAKNPIVPAKNTSYF